jgi:hypothetical protein
VPVPGVLIRDCDRGWSQAARANSAATAQAGLMMVIDGFLRV